MICNQFLVIKSITFIVLTQFFHVNELKILRQSGNLFFKLLANLNGLILMSFQTSMNSLLSSSEVRM